MVKICPSWRSIDKLEYSCTTANLNLPLSNGTIIVLKIRIINRIINSVSVNTNFVIRKRDKKGKNITLFRLQPAHDARSRPNLSVVTVIEEVHAIFALSNFFGSDQ